jgi:chromosome segregation ATPase
VTSLATAATASRSDSTRLELASEQKRLAKLWDAFKKQEDDYRAVERERDDLWSRVQQLEKVTSIIGDPQQTAIRLNTFTKENQRLRADVGDLGNRLDEYRELFQAEQARLAKLYKVYEDTEARLEKSVAELEKWHRWWEKHNEELPIRAAQEASKSTGAKLSAKQLAQRQYAAQMRVVRKRAAKQKGGKGRIKNRAAAKKLRAKLGLKG